MTQLELRGLAATFSAVVREVVLKLQNDFRVELTKTQVELRNEFEARLRSLPEPVVNQVIELDIDAVAQRASMLIPAPRDGKDGKDAEPVDMDAVVQKAVALIPVPKDGRDGVDGKDGKNGIDGRDGQSVDRDALIHTLTEDLQQMSKQFVDALPKPKEIHPDTIALMVRQAMDEAIERLPKPQDGKDAVQIEILPAIDPRKSYPRGTCGEHDGGTWMARQKTTPGETLNLNEWVCFADGLADISMIQSDDLRSFEVRLKRASGITHSFNFKAPFLLDRGIYSEGTEYVRGDVVVWDGSTWSCQVEATKSKPGTADWRLIAKRGRDGKDLRPPDPEQPRGPVKLK